MEFHIIFTRKDLLEEHRALPLEQIRLKHLPAALVALYPSQRLIFAGENGWRNALRPEAERPEADPVRGDVWLASFPPAVADPLQCFLSHRDGSSLVLILSVGAEQIRVGSGAYELDIPRSWLVAKIP